MLEKIVGIKLNAWESVITDDCNRLREEEIKLLKRLLNLRSLFDFLVMMSPFFCTLVCFYTHSYFYNTLDLAKTYVLLLLFKLMVSPVTTFFNTVIKCEEAEFSCKKISFLLKIETPDQIADERKFEVGQIEIENGFFAWSNPKLTLILIKFCQTCNISLKNLLKDGTFTKKSGGGPGGSNPQNSRSQAFDASYYLNQTLQSLGKEDEEYIEELRNIHLHIDSGEFISVIGGTDSGKSSLLYAILQEMNHTEGVFRKRGSIAFVPDTPFIMVDTLKNNITFGKDYDEFYYKIVLEICFLRQEVQKDPYLFSGRIDPDKLSLTQQHKISIARAVYSRSHIYLVDDFLKDFDKNMGAKIFNEVFVKHLSGKTRVIVNKNHRYLEEMSSIVLMDKGQIVLKGTLEQVEQTSEFKDLMEQEPPEGFYHKLEEMEMMQTHTIPLSVSFLDQTILVEDELDLAEIVDQIYQQRGEISGRQFYIKQGGFGAFIGNLFLLDLLILLIVISDLWMGLWAIGMFNTYNARDYTNVYILILLGISLMYYFRALCSNEFTISACRNIFMSTFWLMIRKPLKYFNKKNQQQKMDLFGRHMAGIDLSLHKSFTNFVESLLMIIAIFVLASLISPVLILLYFLVIWTLYSLISKFRRSANQMETRILESGFKLNEAENRLLHGLSSLKVFQAIPKCLEQWEIFHNNHNAWLLNKEFGKLWIFCWIHYIGFSVILGFGIWISLNREIT